MICETKEETAKTFRWLSSQHDKWQEGWHFETAILHHRNSRGKEYFIENITDIVNKD
jgi:hypothetical protein